MGKPNLKFPLRILEKKSTVSVQWACTTLKLNLFDRMAKLIIARHHESKWNKEGLWTEKRNVHLTPFLGSRFNN
jgi:hypothetical protein